MYPESGYLDAGFRVQGSRIYFGVGSFLHPSATDTESPVAFAFPLCPTCFYLIGAIGSIVRPE
tara:strand:- start:233 stop:421 length:189 start_codon:yes stop_codon:yes gene_type:complete